MNIEFGPFSRELGGDYYNIFMDGLNAGHIEVLRYKKYRLVLDDVFWGVGPYKGIESIRVSTPLHERGGAHSMTFSRLKDAKEAALMALNLLYRARVEYGEHIERTTSEDARRWRKLLKAMRDGGLSIDNDTGSVHIRLSVHPGALRDAVDALVDGKGLSL